jgi:hypothetical protein
MKEKIYDNKKFVTALVTSIAVAAITTLIMETPMPGRMMHNEGFNSLMQAKIFFSTLNIGLLAALTANYTEIYRRMNSKFIQSLLITSTALLIYAITSSPLLHIVLGFRGAGLGPFTFIPDIFISTAGTILLYRSLQ